MNLLESAAYFTRAPIAYVLAERPFGIQMVTAIGLPSIPPGTSRSDPPGAVMAFGPATVFEDLTREQQFADHPLVAGPGGWRWFARAPVPLRALQGRVSLCCADTRLKVTRQANLLEPLELVAQSVADTLSLLSVGMLPGGQELVRQYIGLAPAKGVEPGTIVSDVKVADPPTPEPPGVLARFLLKTIVRQRNLRQRDGVSFVTLVRFRAGVREPQLEALKALKCDPPDAFVDAVADDLAGTARELWDGVFKSVVPVPCGHSGSDCLAKRLAERVAQKTGVPVMHAFAPLPVSGSSHPRRSAKLPPLQIVETPRDPVLLIDDVVTSGVHLEAAARMLKKEAGAVFPLAWLAAR